MNNRPKETKIFLSFCLMLVVHLHSSSEVTKLQKSSFLFIFCLQSEGSGSRTNTNWSRSRSGRPKRLRIRSTGFCSEIQYILCLAGGVKPLWLIGIHTVFLFLIKFIIFLFMFTTGGVLSPAPGLVDGDPHCYFY